MVATAVTNGFATFGLINGLIVSSVALGFFMRHKWGGVVSANIQMSSSFYCTMMVLLPTYCVAVGFLPFITVLAFVPVGLTIASVFRMAASDYSTSIPLSLLTVIECIMLFLGTEVGTYTCTSPHVSYVKHIFQTARPIGVFNDAMYTADTMVFITVACFLAVSAYGFRERNSALADSVVCGVAFSFGLMFTKVAVETARWSISHNQDNFFELGPVIVAIIGVTCLLTAAGLVPNSVSHLFAFTVIAMSPLGHFVFREIGCGVAEPIVYSIGSLCMVVAWVGLLRAFKAYENAPPRILMAYFEAMV